MVGRLEELPTPRRVVDGRHKNTVLQGRRSWCLGNALVSTSRNPVGIVLRVEPEAQKPPCKTAATKDAGAFAFEQGFGSMAGISAASPKPACRLRKYRKSDRNASDGAAQHGFELGENRCCVRGRDSRPQTGRAHGRWAPVTALSLSAGRVVAVAVLVTDAAIRTVDDQFRLLVACDVPPASMACCCACRARRLPADCRHPDGPNRPVRNNMLILPVAWRIS